MAGLGGLAFVGQGYDQGAQDYWTRRGLESDNDAMRAAGLGLQNFLASQGAMPGAMPAPGGAGPPQMGPPGAPGPGGGPAPPVPPQMGGQQPAPMGVDRGTMPMPTMRPPGAPSSGGPPPGFINPRQVNGQPQNLTGDIIPPGGTGQAAMPGAQPMQPPPPPMAPPGGQPGGQGFQRQNRPENPVQAQLSRVTDWRQIAAAIKDANPPNMAPDTFFKAMDLTMKQIINPQVQMAYRLDTIEMRERAFEERKAEFDRRQTGVEGEQASRQYYRTGAGKTEQVTGTPGSNLSPAEAKAYAGTLRKLTDQQAAVEAFSKTAVGNLDVLLQLGSKVDATGVPALERWIRAGRKATGDPDVATFDAQLAVTRPEVARIVSNPNLTGALTNQARGEINEILQGGASLGQMRKVIPQLKQDMARRGVSIEEQITATKQRLRGATPATSTSAPAGAPAGSEGTVIKYDAQGNRMPGGQGSAPFEQRSMTDEDPQPARAGSRYAMEDQKDRILARMGAGRPGRGGGEGGGGSVERLPQPPSGQRADRPINQQTLDEMRAAEPGRAAAQQFDIPKTPALRAARVDDLTKQIRAAMAKGDRVLQDQLASERAAIEMAP